MHRSVERPGGGPPGLIGRLRDKTAAEGLRGVTTAALNRLLRRGASIDLVQVMLLAADELVAERPCASVETRLLTSAEVREYAAQPESELSPDMASRIDRGLDFCSAALSEGRLASYCWLALRSVEPEHAAGVALGLPPHMAYLYKAFTLPSFRGRGLYSMITAAALTRLERVGITHLVAFVYWNNATALRACTRMGYRRLGMLVGRPSGPLHVPEAATSLGMRFGADALPMLEERLRESSDPGGSSAVRKPRARA